MASKHPTSATKRATPETPPKTGHGRKDGLRTQDMPGHTVRFTPTNYGILMRYLADEKARGAKLRFQGIFEEAMDDYFKKYNLVKRYGEPLENKR